MVDNILTTAADIDKDTHLHHLHHRQPHQNQLQHSQQLHQLHHRQRHLPSCESMTSSSSSASDTESDVMSDIKDSLFGSPRNGQNATPPGRIELLADKDKSSQLQLSESLLRTYAIIQRQNGGSGGGAGGGLDGGGGGLNAGGQIGVANGIGGGVGVGVMSDLCCSKCGHFQTIRVGDLDMDVRNFKCAKCGGCDTLSKDTTTTILDHQITTERSTIIGGGGGGIGGGGIGVTKPILKFSVSAILGDRKECVKVRNGKG